MSTLPTNIRLTIETAFNKTYNHNISYKPTEYSIIAKVINNTLYCPVCLYDSLPDTLPSDNVDFVLPLSTPLRQHQASTTARILQCLYNYYTYPTVNVNVKNKDYSYIQFGGTLFTEDFKPLMMFMYMINGYKYKNNRNCRPVIMISPHVFQNTDILSKFIVKSLIPNAHLLSLSSNRNTEVIITPEIESFIYKTNVPNVGTFNEEIYQILGNNSDNILL